MMLTMNRGITNPAQRRILVNLDSWMRILPLEPPFEQFQFALRIELSPGKQPLYSCSRHFLHKFAGATGAVARYLWV